MVVPTFEVLISMVPNNLTIEIKNEFCVKKTIR